jgi:hypothetical protein
MSFMKSQFYADSARQPALLINKRVRADEIQL